MTVTYAELSTHLNRGLLARGEWSGVPVPVEGLQLCIEDKNPWKGRLDRIAPRLEEPGDDADTVSIVNVWWSTRLRAWVYIVRDAAGKVQSFVEHLPIGRLEGEGRGPLRLVRLSAGQMTTLRSEYLAVGITPAAAQLNLGVVWGDRLVGAIAMSQPQTGRGDWCHAYQLSDFSIRPTVYKRLSKLVLAAAVSKEMQAILQQSFNRRVTRIGTTAFTTKPVSAKYRGEMFKLHNRKDGALNYVGEAGRWSLADGLKWWLRVHSHERTTGGETIDGDPALPSAEAGSNPAPRSTSQQDASR